ncbi:MAG: hypothetical protein A2606_02325 [Candidatus Yanofskybacteria bacterium RIFOXYD1_FULL_42_10]|uniref:Uncharacterized protein n=1 Tax=Candidatus Yanofskybacteria bacterium RIFOXYD1_FULL_42_10 TaxID=1802718 RepID=A0A1F8HV01_9BACT|nr:MAG: hypothetical protein A2606_02325 [Candidatus Yanofskybacteria bacterium RIFOXYD1_FULL_42_10]
MTKPEKYLPRINSNNTPREKMLKTVFSLRPPLVIIRKIAKTDRNNKGIFLDTMSEKIAGKLERVTWVAKLSKLFASAGVVQGVMRQSNKKG